MRKPIYAFVRDQWRYIPPPEHVDLGDKTVVIIGANTGLGFEATKHFATMNPGRLILACRSQARGDAALEKLRAQTGYKDAEVWLVDLASYQSVLAFAERFKKDGGRLDVLLENAAVAPVMGNTTLTKDGYEETLQVNHLSVALLALALLPAMSKTAKEHKTIPRLVVVSSEVHHWVAPKAIQRLLTGNIFQYLSSDEGRKPEMIRERYKLTKLFNVMFVRELNERLAKSSPVVVDTVNPGFCYSDILRGASGITAVRYWLMGKLLAKTAEEGSRQLVYAALGGKDEDMCGQYISSGKPEECGETVLSNDGRTLQKKLWQETVNDLIALDPSIRQVVDEYFGGGERAPSP